MMSPNTIASMLSKPEYLDTYVKFTSIELWALISACIVLSVVCMVKEGERDTKSIGMLGWTGLILFFVTFVYAVLALIYVGAYSLMMWSVS